MSKATPYTRTTKDGDVLTVARPEEIGADTSDGAWVTFCEKHSTLVYTTTKALALATSGKDFCDDCRADEPAQDDTDGWVELSTDDADDMSEVFQAQAEAAAAVVDLDADDKARVLIDLRAARDAENRPLRRELIKSARALGIAGQEVADAAGVSITYVYDVANGTVRSTPALREYQKGYQSALADVLALSLSGKTRDESLLLIEEWITNNRSAAAASIFAQALTGHGVLAAA